MKGWFRSAAALAFTLNPAPTPAQPSDTLQLTLEEALRIARAASPPYLRAANDASLNAAESRATWFDRVLPQATLSLFNTSFYGNVRRRAQDNFGNPIENPTADWIYFSETSQWLQLDWNIQGGSIFDALHRQRLVNQRRIHAEARALTALEVAVERAFWDALEQEELRRAEEELLAARELDLEVSRRLFRLAARTRVDVLRAELAVEQQRLALRQRSAALEQAKLALRARLGDERLPPFELVPSPLPVFDPAALDTETLVRRALAVNPALREAGAAVGAARVELREAGRAWWPRLFAQYNVTRRAQTSRGDALFDLSWNEALDHRFYVGLQLPMFTNYFQNRQRVAQASVRLANETETEREERLRVEESVRRALLELQNQWETLRLSERAGEIAARALELARDEYRLGTRSFEELRQGVDEEAVTRRQLIEARHAFVDALLDLEEAVGARVRS